MQKTLSNFFLHLVTVLVSLSSLDSSNDSNRSSNQYILITLLLWLFEGLLKTDFMGLPEILLREISFPRLLHFILS